MRGSIDKMAFSIDSMRSNFPALSRTYNGKTVVYLDGPGGSQVCKPVIDAMRSYMENGGANLHGEFPTSIETEAIISNARSAIADFLNVNDIEVGFGANTTTLNFHIASALRNRFKNRAKGEIVVTEMDHRANVDPWILLAKDLGYTVRWIPVNTDTLTLDLSSLETLINSNTVIVAAGLSSNAIGTVSDVKRIFNFAHKFGAITIADAVHAAPHLPVDRDYLDADILSCSAYKFFGPHLGVVAIRSCIFETLDFYKILPAPYQTPLRLETGTQNHEAIASIEPLINFIASQGEGSNRKEKIKNAMRAIQAHEDELAEKIRKDLINNENIKIYMASADTIKTPTVGFITNKMSSVEFCKRMADEFSVFIASGNFYASTLSNKLGLEGKGGWIRAGLAPYNNESEVDRFLDAVKKLTK